MFPARDLSAAGRVASGGGGGSQPPVVQNMRSPLPDLKSPWFSAMFGAKEEDHMTYESFEDLPVWQRAAQLYELTEDLLENESFRASRGFRDQLDRAALSVSNNIAEGFERGTTNELLSFLYIARGSAGEVRSMLRVRLRRVDDAAARQAIEPLIATALSCSKQLRGWADSLQNSAIKGQRHLNDRTRQEFEAERRAVEMQKRLLRALPAWHPKRKEAEADGII